MNFNDYYNYLNEFNDINYIPNNTIENPNNNILNSAEGFKKGNMFKNLYNGYKDYKPIKLTAQSEREDMLMQIQEYSFAATDLELYLDTNPNDNNALNLFNKYLNKKIELINMFEEKYGPLTLNTNVQTNNWLWKNSPWPWEVQK